MISTWQAMGVIRFPLGLSVLVIGGLAAYATVRLFRAGARPDLMTRTWLDAILFWGGFSLVTGVLGTLVGIVFAAQAIETAGAVSSGLVWGGIKVALYSSVFGTLVLAGASLIWFALQLRWRYLMSEVRA